MLWNKDTMPFFIKMICENHYVALPTEIFFKEILIKKYENIELKYTFIWYKKQLALSVMFRFKEFSKPKLKFISKPLVAISRLEN